MNFEEEPYIYYVRCKNHPSLAIQANSKEEYKAMLEDFRAENDIKIIDVEVMTVAEYKRRFK